MSAWLRLSLLLAVCSASFNLYEPSHPLKTVTRLFERLKYYEVITLKHNQLHGVDSGQSPIYPMNGKIEFNAFGRYYKLLIRKNVELFSDNFTITHHKYDAETNTTKKIQWFDVPQCHYTAEIVSDPSGIANARFSVCRGRGLQGWIHAFGETIVIRPKRLLTNFHYKGKHMISDQHVAYRYNDLDRSDYKTKCGHDHIHDDEEAYDGDILFSTAIANSTNSTWMNDRRRMSSSSLTGDVHYVEFAAVNDPAIMRQYGGDTDKILLKTIQSIATVQSYYYHTDWGAIGSIVIVLGHVAFIDAFGDLDAGELEEPSLACVSGGSSPSLYTKGHHGPYCEVHYESYLNNWHDYRSIHYAAYDNAHLLSYYDFKDSVIGYASISGMCSPFTSGAIDQATYDDEYNGNIIAHEMGHNFGMQHDGLGNNCDAAQYIMASKGSTAARPNTFSTCSIIAMAKQFAGYKHQMQCVDNKPLATAFAVCRNGFVELGEVCDCGQEDCTLSGDTCCDGSVCGLYAFAECSNQYSCCSECQIVRDSSQVCRALNEENACDIKSEECDAESAECPPDTFNVEGTSCGDGGYCYHGLCQTISDQCAAMGHSLADGTNAKCGYSPAWKVDECDWNLKCWGQIKVTQNQDQCVAIGDPLDGTPCNKNGAAAAAAQCHAAECQLSSDILAVKWTAFAWSECSLSCKQNENQEAGTQSRIVSCTYYDGSVLDDEECVADAANVGEKPIEARICNDYVCDFCSFRGICGEFGSCDTRRGTCDCNPGFDGEFCDIAPSLNFTGVVSMVFKDREAGEDILRIANPCFGASNGSILAQFDPGTETRTVPQDGVASLDSLFIGSRIGIRWISSGSIDSLAVGMIRVRSDDDDDADYLLSSRNWPFYVGSSLALNQNNKEECDLSDACFNDPTCNDFTFTIPTDVEVGDYRILIRFSNIFAIESDILHVECSESNCNSVSRGSCNENNDGCSCDDGWSGDSCSDSVCDSWSFASSTVDEALRVEIKPKCFSSQCDFAANASDAACGECDDVHFSGAFCELPRDFCGQLSSEAECELSSQCEYSTSHSFCFYSDCFAFKTSSECQGAYFVNETRETWSIFCEWNENDAYCNRITCGDDDILPQCANGAVRRPLYDQFSDSPQSICNGWYCDCSTVNNNNVAQWTQSDVSILKSLISSDYIYDDGYPLSGDFISSDSLPFFLCSHCGLNCSHSSSSQNDCINCSALCPQEVAPFRSGIECNQVFWILSFALNVDHSVIFAGDRFEEFSSLLISDLAYFLATDTRHISLWQIKPEKSKSVIYFRYLFDTNDEKTTQSIAGEIMILAQKEFTDATSIASRGFIMKFTDSQYPFSYCVPTKEECDPRNQVEFNKIFAICFFTSFGVELLAVIIYRIATRKRRQQRYEEQVHEQKRILDRMIETKQNATRIGMRNVSKRRAKLIAKDKKAHKELEKSTKTVYLDASKSFTKEKKALAAWTTHDAGAGFDDDDGQQTFAELQQIKINDSEDSDRTDSDQGTQTNQTTFGGAGEDDDDNYLPPGWQERTDEDGEIYYYDTINSVRQWDRPQMIN